MNSPLDDKQFYRIVVVSSALGFGTLTSFLYSLKDIPDDPTLEFSAGTIITFILGALAGWVFWAVIRHLASKKPD
ncbi:MAG: hypothetical protein SFY81_09700 [Verrucomicrobiota bacterium]|nr:hypothetical protein [Verrucomicrobiota bacterium]